MHTITKAVATACIAVLAVTAALAPATATAGSTTVTMPLWHSTYDWPGGDGSAGWSSAVGFDPFAYGLGTPAGGAPGLWLWLTGGRQYTPGGAEWHLRAPGTTRIANVSLRLAYRNKLFAHHCLDIGLRSGSETRDQRRECSPPAAPALPERYDVTLADPSSEPLAKEAYIRVEMPQCNNPAPTPCSKWIPVLDPVTNGAMVRADRVAFELVDDDRPTVSASGPLRDLAGHYTAGTQSYDVTVAATDPGSGVHRVWVDHIGQGEVAGSDAACDPNHHTASLDSAVCPPASSGDWSFDTNPLPEGAATFAAQATDLAGNSGPEDGWHFFVDRTAPPQPTEFDVDLDADAQLATVSWLANDDPPLADGNPGSGLAEWEYRWRKPDGEWHDWHRGVESLEVPDAIEGDTIDVEARSIDAVGNRSAVSGGRVTVPTQDEEDDTVENQDDDDPADLDVATAARARASAADDGTITLEFVAATTQRRDQALADVDSACSPPLRRMICSEAVKAACRLAGICTTAKKKACAGVRLYCPVADASRVSLVARYQPTFVLDRKDRFWPVSVNTALTMRWDRRDTCLVVGDDCKARGATAIRRAMLGQGDKHDNEFLDLPPHKDDIEDFWKATQDALGIHPRLDLDSASDPGWDNVPKTGRIYWYRGGGFGKGSGTAKSLQYWTYYTYNYLNTPLVGGQGKHEGDWEMAAVVLSGDDQPVWSYMSRHGMRWDSDHEARRFRWNDDQLERDSTHVTVYPGKGSHAVYNHCGDHARSGAPDDHSSCSDVLFFGPDTHRISLGRTSWACWGGHFGNGGTDVLHRYGDSPFSPLWQQDTFAGDRRPCADGQVSASAASSHPRSGDVNNLTTATPLARAAAAPSRDPEETEPVARETQLSAGGDPLIDEFAHCEQWAQPPTEPGATVLACDQKQLTAFIDAGLMGDGGGGPTIVAGGTRVSEIPQTYSSDDPAKLGAISVIGTGSPATVYGARLGVDGTLEEAYFPAVDLPRGEPMIVRFTGAVAELVSKRDGRVVVSVATKRAALTPFRMVQRARTAHAVRRGTKVIVTWRGSRRTRFMVSAGPTEGAARRRRLTDVRSSRSGRYRISVRLKRGERWIGLVAYRGSATSLPTTVPVTRR